MPKENLLNACHAYASLSIRLFIKMNFYFGCKLIITLSLVKYRPNQFRICCAREEMNERMDKKKIKNNKQTAVQATNPFLQLCFPAHIIQFMIISFDRLVIFEHIVSYGIVCPILMWIRTLKAILVVYKTYKLFTNNTSNSMQYNLKI